MRTAARRFSATAAARLGFTYLTSHRCDPPWRILRYQQIVDAIDTQLPAEPDEYTTLDTFHAQMKWLKDNCSVVQLAELIDAHAAGTAIPHRTIALTLDNGWRSTCTKALPVLQELKLPAAVLLAYPYIGSSSVFWTNKISKTVRLLCSVEARTRFEEYLSTLKDNADVVILDSLRAMSGTRRTPIQAYRRIVAALEHFSPEQRKVVLGAVDRLLSRLSAPPERQFLNWTEIVQLHSNGVAIGVHPLSHEAGNSITPERFSTELHSALKELGKRDIQCAAVSCDSESPVSLPAKAMADRGLPKALLTTCKDASFRSDNDLLTQISIGEELASSIELFTARIWLNKIF